MLATDRPRDDDAVGAASQGFRERLCLDIGCDLASFQNGLQAHVNRIGAQLPSGTGPALSDWRFPTLFDSIQLWTGDAVSVPRVLDAGDDATRATTNSAPSNESIALPTTVGRRLDVLCRPSQAAAVETLLESLRRAATAHAIGTAASRSGVHLWLCQASRHASDVAEYYTIDMISGHAFSTLKSAERVASRSSRFWDQATATLAAHENGEPGADILVAVTALCAWIVESLEFVDDDGEADLSVVIREMNDVATVGSSRAAPTYHPGFSVRMVELLQKRASAMRALTQVVDDPKGLVQRVCTRANDACGTSASHTSNQKLPAPQDSSTVLLQWTQRRLALQAAAEQSWYQAAVVSPMIPQLLTIKFCHPKQRQSLEPLLDGRVLDRLGALLVTAVNLLNAARASSTDINMSSSPTSSLSSSSSCCRLSQIGSGWFQQLLLPAIGLDLIANVEALLRIGSDAFTVSSAASDAAVSEGIVAEVVLGDGSPPIATLPLWQAQRRQSVDVLLSWDRVARRADAVAWQHHSASHGGGGDAPSVRLLPSATTMTEAQGPLPLTYVAYAVMVLEDVAVKLDAVFQLHHGLLTREAVCLYRTLEHAALSFPLLMSARSASLQVLRDVWDRTLQLKYTVVDDAVMYPAASTCDGGRPIATERVRAEQKDRHRAQITNGDHHLGSHPPDHRDRVGGGHSWDEERSVLMTRVAILSAELQDCRRLLGHQEQDLLRARAALKDSDAWASSLVAQLATERAIRISSS